MLSLIKQKQYMQITLTDEESLKGLSFKTSSEKPMEKWKRETYHWNHREFSSQNATEIIECLFCLIRKWLSQELRSGFLNNVITSNHKSSREKWICTYSISEISHIPVVQWEEVEKNFESCFFFSTLRSVSTCACIIWCLFTIQWEIKNEKNVDFF